MSEVYVVKPGDTLSQISARYNVKGGYTALAKYNNIANPSRINVGQKIIIPNGSTSGGSTAQAGATASSGKVKITAQALNVRQGAGTSYGVLGTLSKGQVVAYSKAKNGWLQISFRGQTGWISQKYTQTTSAKVTNNKPSGTEKTMYVTATSLNVRSGGSTNDSIIGSLSRGQAVTVLGEASGWARIQYGSGKAYVSMQYLTSKKPSTPAKDTSSNYKPGTGGAFNLDQKKLAKVAKGAVKYYSPLVKSMGEASITTKQRACCYIAQLAHESDHFNTLEEYASGKAYEGRTDLGNTRPGDGVRFKGRGALQLTGRYNYTRASKDLGIDLVSNPKIVSENPDIAFKVSAWYWNKCNLNSYCDNYDFRGLTKAINGGYNGYDSRLNYYNLANKYL